MSLSRQTSWVKRDLSAIEHLVPLTTPTTAIWQTMLRTTEWFQSKEEELGGEKKRERRFVFNTEAMKHRLQQDGPKLENKR